LKDGKKNVNVGNFLRKLAPHCNDDKSVNVIRNVFSVLCCSFFYSFFIHNSICSGSQRIEKDEHNNDTPQQKWFIKPLRFISLLSQFDSIYIEKRRLCFN